MLSENPSYRTGDSLLQAYSRVIDIIPEIVWLGYDIKRRYEMSSQLGELVSTAVSAAPVVCLHALRVVTVGPPSPRDENIEMKDKQELSLNDRERVYSLAAAASECFPSRYRSARSWYRRKDDCQVHLPR